MSVPLKASSIAVIEPSQSVLKPISFPSQGLLMMVLTAPIH